MSVLMNRSMRADLLSAITAPARVRLGGEVSCRPGPIPTVCPRRGSVGAPILVAHRDRLHLQVKVA